MVHSHRARYKRTFADTVGAMEVWCHGGLQWPPMSPPRAARTTSKRGAAARSLDGFRRDRRTLVRRAGLLALAGSLESACIFERERGYGE